MRPALVLEPVAEMNLGSYRSQVGEASLRQRLYAKQGCVEQVTEERGSRVFYLPWEWTAQACAERNVISLAQLPSMASETRDMIAIQGLPFASVHA